METLPSYWRGTIFRSRTEARWAIFFAAIRMRWEYEPEGFKLTDGTWYLPDFWLPEMRTWVEVKPRDIFSAGELRRIELLVAESGFDCLLLDGAPHPRSFRLCSTHVSPAPADWTRVMFSDAHTAARRDSMPRLFWEPSEDEIHAQEAVEAAMQVARSAMVTDPEAGAMLPLGWEHAAVVTTKDDESRGDDVDIWGEFAPKSSEAA